MKTLNNRINNTHLSAYANVANAWPVDNMAESKPVCYALNSNPYPLAACIDYLNRVSDQNPDKSLANLTLLARSKGKIKKLQF
jgi:hypothetical protein